MFEITLSGKAPIYEQLYSGVAGLISSGRLAAGEKLPAVREVAKSFGINPNTVQKAYFMLEQSGLIRSVPAKGSYVSDSAGAAKALKERAVNRLSEAMTDAKRAGVKREEAAALIDGIWSEKEGSEI